jgi:hypothetical protein
MEEIAANGANGDERVVPRLSAVRRFRRSALPRWTLVCKPCGPLENCSEEEMLRNKGRVHWEILRSGCSAMGIQSHSLQVPRLQRMKTCAIRLRFYGTDAERPATRRTLTLTATCSRIGFEVLISTQLLLETQVPSLVAPLDLANFSLAVYCSPNCIRG